MEIRRLTPEYAVSPQIAAEDAAAIREAGFATVICNRPDGEVPPGLQADSIRAAIEAEGLAFVDNPITHATMGPDAVNRQRETLDGSEGPVLAYCASGTRSTVLWLFGAAPHTDPDELLATARTHGYDLETLRPQLASLHGA